MNKRYHIHNRTLFYLLCLCCTVFTSCKKQENDFDKLTNELGTSSRAYIQAGSATLLNGSIYQQKTDSYVGIPIQINNASAIEDSVVAVIDTTLIATFNNATGESNPIIRQDNFELSNSGIYHFKTGASQSYDSLYVNIKNGNGLQDGYTYLIPIRITHTNGLSLKSTIYLIKYKITFSSLNVSFNGGSSAYFYNKYSIYSTSATYSTTKRFEINSYMYIKNSIIQGYPPYFAINLKLNKIFSDHNVSTRVQLLNADSIATLYKTLSNTTIAYQKFPSASITLDNTDLQINKGSLVSSDSLRIRVVAPAQFVLGSSYVFAVKLVKSDDSSFGVLPASDSTGLAFVTLRVFQAN